MSINYRKTTMFGFICKMFSFDDVYSEEYETICCPLCESYGEKKSLMTVVTDDIFGGADIKELILCQVCEERFATAQSFTSDEWLAMPPF